MQVNKTGMWGKFRQAAKDLREMASGHPIKANIDAALAVLEHAPKFYVPNILEVTSLKDGPDEGEEVMLPFPAMAILTEGDCATDDDGSIVPTWYITIAMQIELDLCFLPLVYIPGSGGWAIYPVWMHARKGDTPRSMQLQLVPDAATIDCVELARAKGVNMEQLYMKFHSDLSAIVGLWRLLQVHDTKTQVVPLPKVHESNTRKWGKKGTYDYHVLSVGGEIWDSPHETTDSGGGVRSHLRRGHIRRLSGKTTWVRSTYVHGSREGFVEKDYEVKTPVAVERV